MMRPLVFAVLACLSAIVVAGETAPPADPPADASVAVPAVVGAWVQRQIEKQITEYVDEEYEVQVTRMIPQTTTETRVRKVPVTRTVVDTIWEPTAAAAPPCVECVPCTDCSVDVSVLQTLRAAPVQTLQTVQTLSHRVGIDGDVNVNLRNGPTNPLRVEVQRVGLLQRLRERRGR